MLMFCDDNRSASTFDEIPEWFKKKISHVCVMRKSKIDMSGIPGIPQVSDACGAMPSGISSAHSATENDPLRSLMASIAARNR